MWREVRPPKAIEKLDETAEKQQPLLDWVPTRTEVWERCPQSWGCDLDEGGGSPTLSPACHQHLGRVVHVSWEAVEATGHPRVLSQGLSLSWLLRCMSQQGYLLGNSDLA